MKRTFQSLIVGGFAALALFVMVPAADAAYRTVQPGDTLSKVYGGRWGEVCRINRLANCNLIHVGQRLDDGLGGSTTAVAGVSTSQAVSSSVPLHLVMGKPYVWGATGPGAFDCSGLTQYLARAMGKTVQRTSQQQIASLRWIPLSQARPGDIVAFNYGHVGTYTGNGMVVHAVSPYWGIRHEPVSEAIKYNGLLTVLAVMH